MKKLIPFMIAAAMIIVVFAATDSGSEATLTGTYVNGNPATYGMTVDEPNAHWKYDSDGLTIKALMKIKLLKRYEQDQFTFERLKTDFGVFAVRGPRGVPNSLSALLK